MAEIQRLIPDGGQCFCLLEVENPAQKMCAGVVVEDQLFESNDKAARIACFADFAKGFHPHMYIDIRNTVSDKDANLFVFGGNSVFRESAQLFIEFFTGANAGELDPDVFVRFESGQKNEIPRQVNDLDGLAHVQDADLATLADSRGLEDELTGLRDGHEEAAHVGMRDGDRAPGEDLLFEDRNDAAIGTEHIAEADGDKLSTAILEPEKQELCEPLCGAHYVSRAHCLIG